MNEPLEAISDDGRKLLDVCISVVFGGVTVGLETEDPEREALIVRELWPAALDLSGYQIAKECVLALAAVGNIPNDVLAHVAMVAMGKLPAE